MSTPSPDKNISYVDDMLEAADRAVRLSAGRTLADLSADELFQLAMLHLIQIVGEAAFKVSTNFRQRHQEVPWNKIAATRHRIVHDYSHVDLDVVWEILTLHLPQLVE